MEPYHWRPIEPLSNRDRKIDLSEFAPLYGAWRTVKARLEQSSPRAFTRFHQRLVRSLSIETGILGRLYELDRDTTDVLVESGFMDEWVRRSSTDIEPTRLIDILRDHQAAIEMVIDWVAGERELENSHVHELHEVLTRHQETMAVTRSGTRREIPLGKGVFKEHPDDPPNGTVYCPPEHVESEMDNLLAWLDEYQEDDPLLSTAWLHHRFTQIHPYQDANGRVAQALTSWALMGAGLLPVVIDRDMRAGYIEALQRADRGDLKPLVRLLARLERAAILRASSVDADADMEPQVSAAVIEHLSVRWARRNQREDHVLRRLHALIRSLRDRARQYVEDVFQEFGEAAASIILPKIFLKDGGPDHGNAHWYREQIVASGKRSGKFINFDDPHYFIKATFRAGPERLVFVVSFHHVGRQLSSFMECTVFALIESYEKSNRRTTSEYLECSNEPFAIVSDTQEADIAIAFERWLDSALAVAIKAFGDRL